MAETIIKIDLNKSAYENEKLHNRWHPDIPMAATVKPGDDFILECVDWTGGQIKNDDDASDVRDVDLSQVHFLSGPVGVEGAEPGDLLEVDILDIGTFDDSQWGFNGFFSKPSVYLRYVYSDFSTFNCVFSGGYTALGFSIN